MFVSRGIYVSFLRADVTRAEEYKTSVKNLKYIMPTHAFNAGVEKYLVGMRALKK